MTRFARARGSKSSNERLPEDPTSWQVMKQQLIKAQQHPSSAEGQPRKVFTVEKDHVDNGKSEWAVFEEQSQHKVKKFKTLKIPETDKVRKKQFGKNYTGYAKDTTEMSVHKIKESNNKVKGKKKKKVKMIELGHESDTLTNIKTVTGTSGRKKKVKESKSVERKSSETALHQIQVEDTITASVEGALKNEVHTPKKNINDARKKKLQKTKIGNNKKKPFKNSHIGGCSNDFTTKTYDKPYKRRKPDDGITTLYINGKEVVVRKYGGFPVMKEDADRLEELHCKLVKMEIPQNEIEATMKLERRKAEKALARERKKVCFQCRKAGHNLSECPELDSGKGHNTSGIGICFKCGSTEHTHFECLVTRGQEFRFAVCFVCNEQGHIARQCPDNPRGLYPKGGGCRVCGDVTHFKKDCPDLVKEKEEHMIRLETLDNKSLEVLDEDLRKVKSKLGKSNTIKRKHTVKF